MVPTTSGCARPLLWFAFSHLVLLAPGSGRIGILHRDILLWGELKVRGSFAGCLFSTESVTFKKGRELESVHLPHFRQFSVTGTVASSPWEGRKRNEEGCSSSHAPGEQFATACKYSVTWDAVSTKIIIATQENSCEDTVSRKRILKMRLQT